MEDYWICQMRAWGIPLTNVSGIKREYKESLKIKWERHDLEFERLERRKLTIERDYKRLMNRVMPPQMNTKLGKKVWEFDIKKEKDRLTNLYWKTVAAIEEKSANYYLIK